MQSNRVFINVISNINVNVLRMFLCHQDQFEGRWSHTDSSAAPQLFPLTSVVSDRDMPFNTTCGQLPVVCFLVRILAAVTYS